MGQGPAASVSRHDAQAYGGRCPTHLIRESANVRNPQGRQVQSREDGEKEHGVAQRREVPAEVLARRHLRLSDGSPNGKTPPQA
eukprot:2941428-Pyramimonas_sp.AAC.1